MFQYLLVVALVFSPLVIGLVELIVWAIQSIARYGLQIVLERV